MKKNLPGILGHAASRCSAILCLCLALGACDLFATADQLKSDAAAALAARNYGSAVQMAQKWSEKTPDHYEAFFLLAQAHAQAGDKNGALVALAQAIEKGLKDDAQIDGNTNLDPIKTMSAYETLMKKQFPDRKSKSEESLDAKQDDKGVNAEASILEKDGQQVLRAGDVVIQVPLKN